MTLIIIFTKIIFSPNYKRPIFQKSLIRNSFYKCLTKFSYDFYGINRLYINFLFKKSCGENELGSATSRTTAALLFRRHHYLVPITCYHRDTRKLFSSPSHTEQFYYDFFHYYSSNTDSHNQIK